MIVNYIQNNAHQPIIRPVVTQNPYILTSFNSIQNPNHASYQAKSPYKRSHVPPPRWRSHNIRSLTSSFSHWWPDATLFLSLADIIHDRLLLSFPIKYEMKVGNGFICGQEPTDHTKQIKIKKIKYYNKSHFKRPGFLSKTKNNKITQSHHRLHWMPRSRHMRCLCVRVRLFSLFRTSNVCNSVKLSHRHLRSIRSLNAR